MIWKVRKDFMVFKQRDFIVKRSTVVDFLYARSSVYYNIDEENEAALSLFCELRISSRDQFCL